MPRLICLTPEIPRRRAQMLSSSVSECTANVIAMRHCPPGTLRAFISLIRTRSPVSTVAISSISPSRSVPSSSRDVINVASGDCTHVTRTQRPACAGSLAPFAFGQSRRWTDTP